MNLPPDWVDRRQKVLDWIEITEQKVAKRATTQIELEALCTQCLTTLKFIESFASKLPELPGPGMDISDALYGHLSFLCKRK